MESEKEFNQVTSCLSCGQEIIMVKLDYIKAKLPDISKAELQGFKRCTKCKRQDLDLYY